MKSYTNSNTITTSFTSNQFQLTDTTDLTKKLNINCASIPTNSTVVLSVPSVGGTILTSAAAGSGVTSTLVTTYTTGTGTHTPNANTKFMLVELWGAGGGGGGAGGPGGQPGCFGYSGGGGAYLKRFINSPLSAFTYTVGAGGTGGIWASGISGVNGGTTSISLLSLSCAGGFGGNGNLSTNFYNFPAGGGTPSGTYDVGINGGSASLSIYLTGLTIIGASGYGSGYYGTLEFITGSQSMIYNGVTGTTSAGGSGAISTGTTQVQGGSGGPGLIVITEYIA